MIQTARLDELRQLHLEAAAGGEISPFGAAMCDAFPELIDEVARLRDENTRLKDGLGEVRELLEMPMPGLGRGIRGTITPVGLL